MSRDATIPGTGWATDLATGVVTVSYDDTVTSGGTTFFQPVTEALNTYNVDVY